MTIKELIKLLKEKDQNKEIIFATEFGYCEIFDAIDTLDNKKIELIGKDIEDFNND